MRTIVIKIKIPDELEDIEEKIIKIIKCKAEEIIKKMTILNRTKGCLKEKKTWQELEDELYEDIHI